MTLKERLEIFKEKGWTYNPETGDVYSNTGKLINVINEKGYIRCGMRLKDKVIMISAHQLAWFLYHNQVPEPRVDGIYYEIDHIDRNRSNNKISNLRYVTKSKNQHNRNNTKGYCLDKENNKFLSPISLNNKSIHLGYFDTEEEAKQAYLEAKKTYHTI